MLYTLCSMHYALCAMLYVLCSMCYALCALLYMLCSMCSALRALLYTLCSTCYALRAMLYMLMPTHAYAYPHHRRVVPKAQEHLVNILMEDGFFMVRLKRPNMEVPFLVSNQLSLRPTSSATTIPKSGLSHTQKRQAQPLPLPQPKKESKLALATPVQKRQAQPFSLSEDKLR